MIRSSYLFVTLAAVAIFSAVTGQSADIITKGELVEKQKSISGNWSIEREGAIRYIVLAEDFKAKRGPDLKIFLSPTPLASVTGKTALNGSVLIAELKSVNGAQKYPIPSDMDLAEFKSLLIHCEKYAVLWGGGEL